MKTNQTPNYPQSRTPRQCSLLTALCAGALLLTGALPSLAASGTWINTSSETWSNTANWSGGTVADGAGNTADFNTLDLFIQTTVTLDSARTLGTLIFGDTDTNTPAGWLIANGGVAGNTIAATNITVNPVFAVNSDSATNDAIIAGVVTGTSFVKKGAGTLLLQSANTMTSLQVDEGLIAVGNATALGTSNQKVVHNGGGIRISTSGTIANTNEILTTGHIYAPPTGFLANYDALNGPWVGSASATLYLHLTSGRLTPFNANANALSNFFGTIDLADSVGGLLRLNLGSGSTPYNCSAITFNLGTNNGRIAPRITTTPATFRIGALAGGPNTRLESSEQGTGLNTTWEIGELNTSTLFQGRLLNYATGRHGHLRKVGTGRLTLTHASHGYTGGTTVSNGVLALSNLCSIASSPVVNVAAGAILDASGLTSGSFGLAAAQTLGGNGGVIGNVTVTNGTIAPGIAGIGTLSFTNNLSLAGTLTVTNLFEVTTPGTADVIQVAGDLSFANTVVVRVVPTGALIPNGTYPLFKWGGNLTGDTNNMSLEYPAQPGTLVLQTNLVAKEIRLVVSGVTTAANLVWKGDGLANDWDAATLNWLNGATPSLFVNGDKVTFNDTGSNNVPVNLAANVNPGSLLVNATKHYTLGSSGAFGIIGSSTLVKSNTGVLTVSSDNAFTGGTLIAGGAIQIGDGALSSGSLSTGNVTNNAKLIYNRPDNITNVNLIVGSGAVVQSSPAVLTIAGNNTYSGGTTISNGTVNLDAYNTLGTGPLNLAGGKLIIVPTGGSTTGVSNAIVVAQDSILQYNGANSFAAVILAPISGTPGKTLTVNHTLAGGQDRLRLYASFTNDANLVLNDPSVWIAPYASGPQVYNGVISGTGSFVNRAGGTITFNANNTFTGDARLTTGTYGVGANSVGTWPSLTSSPLGLGSLVLTNESDTVGGNGGITAIGGARNVGNTVTYSRTNEFTFIVSGANNLTLSGPVFLHGQVDNLGGVSRTFQVTSTGTTTLSGEISDNELDCGLAKTGNGLLVISGTDNTYTGLTTVSGGRLQLDGIVPGSVTVQSGGTLGGTGTVGSAITVDAGGTLSPGASLGTLTASNNITLGGTLYLELDRTQTPKSDKLVSSGGTITYGGTLSVKNIGPALQVGDSFPLFPSAVTTFSSIQLSPTDDSGSVYTWENRVAIDGSIKVTAITERIYVATTLNQLISFGNTAPGAILSSVAITGLQPVEAIVGIDFRTNVLYAVGDSSRLYTINRTSGAATAVGGQFSPVLSGTVFGMEVEPGGVRVVTDLGQNLLLDFTTGAATVGTTLNGSLTNVSGLARNPASGQLYVADYLQNKIGTFNPTTGFVTNVGVSGLAGIDFARNNGLDISAVAGNTAYLASPAASSDPAANLYTINLGNGSASLVGLIGNLGDNFLIRGLAVGPAISAAASGIATNPTNITFSASGGNLTISWPADHIGWSLQAQTNTRAVGLKTNWFTLGGYETTNTAVIPISPANPTVFYRLFYLVP